MRLAVRRSLCHSWRRHRRKLAAESLLDREIDCKQVTPERLQKSGRFRDFVRRASAGPREYVVGPPGAFEEMVK